VNSPAADVAPQSAVRLGGWSLLGLLGVVVGAVPFLALLGLVQVRWAPLERLDTGAADGLNATVADSPLSVRILSIVSEAGGGATASFLMAVAVLCLLIRRRHRLAAYVAVAGVGLAVLVPVTKALIGRTRPDVPLPVVDIPTNASFPSGHAMTSLVTWGVLLLVLLPGLRPTTRRWWTAATSVLVLVVGFTRVALGVHFVSDVLAGWALGIAWLAVVTLAFRRWLRTRAEPVHPVGAGVVTGGVADGSVPVGIPVLHNEAVPLETPGSDGPPLYIVGLAASRPGLTDIDVALADVPDDAARIVMMHNPTAFADMPARTAPLAVAGHTHCGQIALPGMPRWSYLGLTQEERIVADGWAPEDYGAAGKALFVTCGIGFSVAPVRINAAPQLVVFTLETA